MNTVIVQLVNKSTFTFHFKKIVVNNPGNTIYISRQILFPGQTCTITGTIHDTDLSGCVYFCNNANFNIFDPLQFNDKQVIFEMNNTYISSIIQSQKFNPNINPRSLLITEATVVLTNRQI